VPLTSRLLTRLEDHVDALRTTASTSRTTTPPQAGPPNLKTAHLSQKPRHRLKHGCLRPQDGSPDLETVHSPRRPCRRLKGYDTPSRMTTPPREQKHHLKHGCLDLKDNPTTFRTLLPEARPPRPQNNGTDLDSALALKTTMLAQEQQCRLKHGSPDLETAHLSRRSCCHLKDDCPDLKDNAAASSTAILTSRTAALTSR
jgi:hypothetical protein